MIYRGFLGLFLSLTIISCSNQDTNPQFTTIPTDSLNIIGSWKLVYAHTQEGNEVSIKNTEETDFIKIISPSHFAFFNQPKDSIGHFVSGAGVYEFEGNNYTETLQFIDNSNWRNQKFSFTIHKSGDTLIQQGHEEVPEAGVNRYIVEKYIPIK